MDYGNPAFWMVAFFVTTIATLIGIGVSTGWLRSKGTFFRSTHPRQWDVVAGSMHREPVYPGEDDPIRADDA